MRWRRDFTVSFRDVQRLSDLTVGQFRPRMKEKHLALLRTKARQSTRERPIPKIGIGALDSQIFRADRRIGACSCIGAQHPPLATPVMAKQVRGDPIQPRTHRPLRIVAGPVHEGRGKRRLGQILSARPRRPAAAGSGREVETRSRTRRRMTPQPLVSRCGGDGSIRNHWLDMREINDSLLRPRPRQLCLSRPRIRRPTVSAGGLIAVSVDVAGVTVHSHDRRRSPAGGYASCRG